MIWYRDWIFYVLTIAVIIFDQITKYVVRETIPLYDTLIEVGIFSIVHGQNTGSAFGLFAGFTNFLIIASFNEVSENFIESFAMRISCIDFCTLKN